MRTIRHRHEFLIAVVLVGLCVLVGVANPAFFSLSNLFDLLKSTSVMGLFAIGVLIVLVSGGIDISFTAIAALCMYLTSRTLVHTPLAGSIVAAFLLSALLGLGLGLFNAVFISCFRLPTLIVTLATAGMFRGFMLAFVGTAIVNTLPTGMVEYSKWTVFAHVLPGGETIGLSLSPFLFAAATLMAWLALRYTTPGRGVYAMGGNPEAAERCGFNLRRLRFLIYGLVGCLSGMAGVIHASTMRNANPFDLVGTELTVIAAVVLGGASITGGRGTVVGTVLGVFLMVTMNNSLILLGIPAYFQRVATGLIIIISTAISARTQASWKGGLLWR
jgi:simple sugar transport system permease protein